MALESLPAVIFNTLARQEAAQETECDRLYQQIGKLKVKVDSLWKKPDISDERSGEARKY